jgi:hypothetical protein
MLVGAKTLVNDNRFSEFLLGDAVDSLSPGFILQYRSTGHEPFSVGGVIFAFAQENTVIMFDDEINGDEWDIIDDGAPLGRWDRFVFGRHRQSK